MKLRFSPSEIETWAGRYRYRSDANLLNTVGPSIRKQRYFTKEQLHAICKWKSPRSAGRIKNNDAQFVMEVSRLALRSTNERIRIEAFTLLDGVGYPIASTLLHFGLSERYPILDVRALWSLGIKLRSEKSRRLNFSLWHEYMRTCRKIADRAGVSVRTLDKALWQYSKKKQKRKRPPSR